MFSGHSFGRPLHKALIPLAASVPSAALAIHSISFKKYSEDLEPAPEPRYRPPSINQLCMQTKFSKKELQIMYRAFKQGCPNGTVLLEQFQEIYAQFFPQGNASRYAGFVFKTFDRDNDGLISFEDYLAKQVLNIISTHITQEFVVGLSVISRGTILEKLGWIFSLYDVCQRGSIGYNELILVVRSVYELLGSNSMPPVSTTHVKQHVIELFGKMDMNNDGEISREEFVEMCQRDKRLCDSLSLFDTYL